MRLPALCAAALAAAAWSCGDDGGSGDDTPGDDAADPDAPPGTPPDASPVTCTPVAGTPALGVETVVDGLDMPVFVTSPPNDPRLFILEKNGLVRVVEDGLLLPEPFVDVGSVNVTSLSDERGLLGLAFHPQFATNRKLYVFYMSAAGEHVVEQWLADADNPNVAEAGSAAEVLSLQDFAGNHNGGMIAFGPDGYLYIGIGDGGNANDPNDYGENTTVWFGKLLRIDVDTLPYTIPADNPLVDGLDGNADEIWSYGLRNPWRWSFDRQTGDLYIGDVGQGSREEVDVQPASSTGGVNYGWDTMEGTRCFEPSSGCDTTGRTPPVYEYTHNEGCTVIGGYVYRGCRMPGYHGTYFFAEYCGGWTRSFRWDGGGGFTDEQEWAGLSNLGDIVSFGEDAAGELYIVLQDSPDGGKVVRVVPQ